MADVFTKHAASLAQLETYLGDATGSFRWSSVDYPCLASGTKGGKVLGEGGYRITAEVGIVVRTELFSEGLVEGDRPQEKQTIIFTKRKDSTPHTLRIDNITEISDRLMLLQCNSPDQGA